MAYAPSKSKKNRGEASEMPNMTSMMDMMTIMLLFLLKTISSSGAMLHPAQGIQLPVSTLSESPQQHISFIINNQGIYQDKEGFLGRELASAEELESDQVQVFTQLTAFLDSLRGQDEALGRKAETIVTLQGDSQIKYKYIYKFIQSCGYSGFGTVQFIVEKKK
jgi:biopolymer transport protein ExbD